MSVDPCRLRNNLLCVEWDVKPNTLTVGSRWVGCMKRWDIGLCLKVSVIGEDLMSRDNHFQVAGASYLKFKLYCKTYLS